jgi:hypothetical protein
LEQLLMWLVPLWTLGIALVLAFLTRKRFKNASRWLAAGIALVALAPWLPASHAEQPRKASTQIVYRFDDHRYLSLTGYGCEGSVDYVDEKRKILTNVVSQYWRVFLPRIVHSDDDGDYIFIPFDDISGFMVSRDHGLTFKEARWVGLREFGVENIKQITVVHQQAFIETKDGRLFMTSKPFGEGWGMNVIDAKNFLPTTIYKHRPEFQHLPTKAPPVKNYKGWTEMHCDPDLQGEPVSTLGSQWNAFQNKVLVALSDTVALPVTLAVRYFGGSAKA